MITQSSSFFELAALLIPVLMLSGAVTARLHPPRLLEVMSSKREWPWVFVWVVVVVAFGLFPVYAELTALSAVMAGGPSTEFHTWIVALAVAFGTYTVAFAWLWPWVRAPWTFLSRKGKAVVATAAVALVIASTLLLRTGVELQQTRDAVSASDRSPPATSEDVSFYVVMGDLLDITLRRLDAEHRTGTVSKRAYLDQYDAYQRLWVELVGGELKARDAERERQLREMFDALP